MAAITGTVSEVNLKTGKEIQEIPVGLQPTALYQDGSALFVANSNDDSLSVIDEKTNRVTQTVRTNPVPGAQVGSYANAINMSDPTHVLVSIGRDNAIAVYRYQGLYRQMRFAGLIPTDWYPVQVQPDPALGAGKIVVTNDKGIGAQGPESTINKGYDTTPATDHNTYDDTGSVTTFTMPHDGQLSQDTQTVFTDDDWNQIKPINQGDYDTVPNVIPAHLGGSSPIKHVVVIVRENRTYDQVLGDLGRGQRRSGRRSVRCAGHAKRPRARQANSATSTTSTTRARSRPTVTTGSSRPRPTTTSRRSSGRSTARTRRRPVTHSPTSATASSGTRPRRPA